MRSVQRKSYKLVEIIPTPLYQKMGPPPKYIFFIFSMIFIYFYCISQYEDPYVSFFTLSEIFSPKG